MNVFLVRESTNKLAPINFNGQSLGSYKLGNLFRREDFCNELSCNNNVSQPPAFIVRSRSTVSAILVLFCAVGVRLTAGDVSTVSGSVGKQRIKRTSTEDTQCIWSELRLNFGHPRHYTQGAATTAQRIVSSCLQRSILLH